MKQTRRNFLKTVGLGIAGTMGASCNSNSKRAKQSSKPNLLFIMTDQQRYDALRIAGNSHIQTPNLDKLARAGAFFSNAYTPCPVCVPARVSILTGHTNENTNVKDNLVAYAKDQTGIAPMKTFDEILTENGYTCAYFGKWHAPLAKGAVYVYELPDCVLKESQYGRGMNKQYNDYLDKNWPKRELKPGELYDTLSGRPYAPDPIDPRFGTNGKVGFKQSDIHGVLSFPAEHSVTAFHGSQTIEALRQLKDKPFSITCSFNPPHPPVLSIKKYRDMYPPDKMTIPESIHDPMEHSPYRNRGDRRAHPEYADEQKIKYMIANYYALVTEIDDWVGKILNELDELGLADNTMVIFTSDHGEMLGSHGMRGKFIFYEESVHVPLIVKYPNVIQENTEVKEYVSTIDLFATILDYMEVDPSPSDGSSLRDLIEKKPLNHGDYVVSEWLRDDDRQSSYMVLSGGWKLICGYVDNATTFDALYDLNDDPYEIKNLLGTNRSKGKHKKTVERLKAQLMEWLEKTGSENLVKLKNRTTL